MYGLPAKVDLSFLRDATLIQICIGENEVVLNLDPNLSIMIASTIHLKDGEQRQLEDSREQGTALLPLLGQSVTDVQGARDGTLRLAWDGGTVIEVLDSSKDFESYTIGNGESTIVV